jgi:16S rRNA (cytosine1402-N4)-methyltransferase
MSVDGDYTCLSHISVLKQEVIEYLKSEKEKLFIDCTFGAGGHTKALLEAGAKVIAIDRDKNNEKFANELQKQFEDKLLFINDKFSNLEVILNKYNLNYLNKPCSKLEGILYDICVSSMQIDEADRGFSFQKDGKLDMRMGCNSISAEEIVNKAPESELADIIFQYGDERFAKKITNAIVSYRERKPISTTLELADIIKNCLPFYHDKIHPATRTFQALRIAVNDELHELEKSLEIASTLTPVGCRIAVITFHSLEDRIVKNIFNKYSKGDIKHFNRNDPNIWDLQTNLSSITLKVITKKPIVPNEAEVSSNIRS